MREGLTDHDFYHDHAIISLTTNKSNYKLIGLNTASIDHLKQNMRNILLVIEDEPLLADLYRTVGMDIGFDVMLADDLESIESNIPRLPSVVLMDLTLPSIDPHAVLEKLIASNNNAHLIIISGAGQHAIESALLDARQLGIKSCFGISKPVDLGRLRSILRDLLASQNSE